MSRCDRSRRRRPIAPYLGVFLLAACGAAEQARVPAADDPVWASVDERAREFQKAHGLPGLSIAVLRGEDVVFAKGYGWADVERRVPVTPETMFPIGSIEKEFTAAAVVRLAEQGKLGLDDPITKYIPDLDTGGYVVTLRHMLHQVSGLTEGVELEEEAPPESGFEAAGDGGISAHTAAIDVGADFDPGAYVASFRGQSLYFPPGQQWSYSQANFDLVCLVIADLTGKTYYEAIGDLADAAGLDRFHADWTPRPSTDEPHVASGYVRDGGEIESAWEPNLGSGWTTAPDLARWAWALENGAVVSGDGYTQMTTPARLNDGRAWPYGLGLGLVQSEAGLKLVHTGSVLGFWAVLARYPEHDLTIAIMVNLGRAPFIQALEKQVARLALGIAPPRIEDLPLSDQEMARFTGSYASGDFGFDVVPDGNRIALDLVHPSCGGPCHHVPLLHQGGGRFISADEPDWLEVVFAEGAGPAREVAVSWPTQAPSQAVRRAEQGAGAGDSP